MRRIGLRHWPFQCDRVRWVWWHRFTRVLRIGVRIPFTQTGVFIDVRRYDA